MSTQAHSADSCSADDNNAIETPRVSGEFLYRLQEHGDLHAQRQGCREASGCSACCCSCGARYHY